MYSGKYKYEVHSEMKDCVAVFRRSGLTRDGGSMTTMGEFRHHHCQCQTSQYYETNVPSQLILWLISGRSVRMPMASLAFTECGETVQLHTLQLFNPPCFKGGGHSGDSSSCIWSPHHRPLGSPSTFWQISHNSALTAVLNKRRSVSDFHTFLDNIFCLSQQLVLVLL